MFYNFKTTHTCMSFKHLIAGQYIAYPPVIETQIKMDRFFLK